MTELLVTIFVLACLAIIGGIFAGWFEWVCMRHRYIDTWPQGAKIWVSPDLSPADFGLIGHWELTGATDNTGFREWQKIR